MAQTLDIHAQKQRRQKVILAVGAVLLIGLLAFQGPKLLNRSKSSSSTPATPTSAAPAATTPAEAPTPTTPAPSVTVTTTTTKATGPSVILAGVTIASAGAPVAGEGDLWSFSRFETKDPFAPQASETSGESAPATPEKAAEQKPAQSGSTGVAGNGTGEPAPTEAAPAAETPAESGSAKPATVPEPTNATIEVNGKPEQLTVKGLFPKDAETFVLVALKPKTAKVGVAGGAFTNGKTLTLTMDKAVTLLNTTTGERYVMKLVYTGTAPEEIAGFTAPEGSQTAAQPAQSSQTAAQATSSP